MWVVIVEGEGAVLRVNSGRPIVTKRGLCDALFSNYFKDLFTVIQCCEVKERAKSKKLTLLRRDAAGNSQSHSVNNLHSVVER